MATKTTNLNSELRKWIRKLRPKLTYEQKRMFRDRPEVLLEAVVDSYKHFCEGQGIDYTTTDMYQAELEFHRFQERLQAARKKWAYLDTPLGIELFNMAIHNVRERKMISLPNFFPFGITVVIIRPVSKHSWRCIYSATNHLRD